MAHPYHHALSSVKHFGGCHQDYQRYHDWFDATKAHFADFRHRALRHHSEGVAYLISLPGNSAFIKNSDNQLVSLQDVGELHVTEDCLTVPSVKDWADHLRVQPWMKRVQKKAFAPEKTWGGNQSDYRFIDEFFNQYQPLIRHHIAGTFDLEASFGITIQNSTGRNVPTRVLGEEYLRARYGLIPHVSDWLKNITGQQWMVKTNRFQKTIELV